VSLNAELAAAARWISAAVERLPENARPDIALEWGELMDTLEDCRSEGSKELAVLEWRPRWKSVCCTHPYSPATRMEMHTNEPD
jgi:hypothetical protein